MQATLVNDWWMTTNQGGTMGTTNTSGITDKQKHNAQKVYDYFSALGWSLSAIAGIIGNMQLESWLSPALVEGTHRSQFPNSASDLSDVPNNVALEHYNHNNHSASGYGLGLVQWDGYTSTSPAGHKLVSFAIRYGLTWYDGDTQLFRIKREYETNIQWSPATIAGVRWTWQNFVTNTQTPETSAKIWRVCYEVAAAGTDSTRQSNARFWYNYFSTIPPTPPEPPEPGDEWITGDYFAHLALAYDGQYIPYSQLDCIGFVNKVWRDIYYVSQNNWNLTNGTNSIWRSTRTFNTTSPSVPEKPPAFTSNPVIGADAAKVVVRVTDVAGSEDFPTWLYVGCCVNEVVPSVVIVQVFSAESFPLTLALEILVPLFPNIICAFVSSAETF